MKSKFVLMLLIFISTASFAGNIRGLVKNNAGDNLEYVTIRVEGTDRGTTTNSEGSFFLKNLHPGQYTLSVNLINFQTKTFQIHVDNETTDLGVITLEQSNQSLNEVVVSASANNYITKYPANSIRLNEPLVEVPQNIQVISSAIIADQQILSMSDGIIRNVSGVSRQEHWGDLYTRVNMRGGRAAAFREGMNITSTWGPLTEDMSFVESVEFVKGPAGFMMSNGDPTGIYNVVTKKPSGQTKGQASLTFGSYDLYRASVDLDGKLNNSGKLLYRLNLMGQLKNSFRKNEFNNRYSIAPVVTYIVDDNTRITAQYTLQHVEMSNVGSYYSFSTKGYKSLPRNFTMLASGMEPTKINDHTAILNLQHNFTSDWKLTAQAAYFNYNQVGSSMWLDSINEAGYINRRASVWDAVNEMKFGQVFVNGKFNTGNVKHRVLAGLDMGNKEYWADWSQSALLDTIGSFNIYNPNNGKPALGYPVFDRSKSIKERSGGPQTTQTYTSIYLQDELGFFNEMLRLTLAGRYTYVKSNSYGTIVEKRQFTPRVGLSYSFDPNTSVYALYDKTFVPQNGVRRDGKGIKPVTGNNMELGAKKLWFAGRFNTTLSLYRIIQNNLLASDPDNAAGEPYVVEVGQTRDQGVEFDMQGEIVKGLTLVANYAFNESVVTKSSSQYEKGTRLPGVSKHTINANLRYKFQSGALNGFNIQAGCTSMIDRSSWWADNGSAMMELPNYFRVDAGAGWTNGALSINLLVNNVFDKYLYSGTPYTIGQTPAYYWQTESPVNYKFNVTYNF
ncbi:TonB-dependent siderophore receptor [Dysgonomonas macrotermitis]|uniref:Iron complex outermembrane recepter protein n=1 Tax=Dysgonomonas macrotermitis TaxID=1346286 RepID=A0A1M4ZY94_9BACT|nr:TonB-dependent siderophore receptor [Dysgonomonas macrotermitis]SHF22827.1 iron complex outermembrane recepter protein [Dysgonomonas macrotermitis]